MKHISILVPEGQNNLSSIVGAYKILKRANAHAAEQGMSQRYEVALVGISKEVNFHEGLFSVRPQYLVGEIDKTDLIIIPSLNHNYQEAIHGNQQMIDWMVEQYKNGAEIASVCTGAFLLAASGLLDGKS